MNTKTEEMLYKKAKKSCKKRSRRLKRREGIDRALDAAATQDVSKNRKKRSLSTRLLRCDGRKYPSMPDAVCNLLSY